MTEPFEINDQEPTSSWQKYSNRRLCKVCQKMVAVWISIADGSLCCDECVPRTRTLNLKQGIEPIWDEHGKLLNLPTDYERIKGDENIFPDTGWEYVEKGIKLDDDPDTAVLRQFVRNTNQCPECFEPLGECFSSLEKSYKCPKCRWSTRDI